MKEEALKLADEIDNFYKHHNQPYFLIQLQAMIRRLVEELDKQNPLSDEEIDKVASIKMNQILMDLIDSEDWNKGCTKQHLVNFARAIEERHGIK